MTNTINPLSFVKHGKLLSGPDEHKFFVKYAFKIAFTSGVNKYKTSKKLVRKA